VHHQNLFAAADIRQANHYLTVKTPRTQQRLIEHIGTVGCGNHDDTGIGLESIHLDQQLVECLFALIIATAHTGTTMTSDRINFVDENNAWRILFGIFKHVTHP